MNLEFQEKIIMEEEWLTSMLKKGVSISILGLVRGQDKVEVKCMIDLGLVKKDMLLYVHDVNTVK